jgi:chromosome partitioning protein
MRTIAVANQKGGVGKSTIAVHLVWLARERGIPTLLIDLDGQANSSSTFADARAAQGLSASMLFASDPAKATALPQPVAAGTWLIPADIDVNDIESAPLGDVCRPVEHLARIARHLPAGVLVVIDTPPNLGRRLIGALVAADAVVSPLAPNGYALQGITDLQQTILMVQQRFNPALHNLGLLLNMVSARSHSHARMLRDLRDAVGDKVLDITIGQRVAIADAVDERRPVWRATKGEGALLAGREMRAACARILDAVFAL